MRTTSTVLLLLLPAFVHSSGVVKRLTRDSKADQGLNFSILTDRQDGWVDVDVAVPRQGKFANLAAMRMSVKDIDGKEGQPAPLATRTIGGVTQANFRLPSFYAERCSIILEAGPVSDGETGVSYVVELKEYLPPGRNERQQATATTPSPRAAPSFAGPPDPADLNPVTGPPKKGWAKLSGRVVWEGQLPTQVKIVPGVNKEVCARDTKLLEEDYLIDPKTRGLKNVFVWIQPTGAEKGAPFSKEKIHPELRKPTVDTVSIDSPCCRFIPHVLAARAGQKMVLQNSAPIAHNPKWSSADNGDINPLIAAGGKFELPKPLVAETGEISLHCSLHSWMKAHIRVFDHPYFAVTDAVGNFEINNAPVGDYNLFIHHPTTGWLNGKLGRKGQPINIKVGEQDLGVFKMKEP